MGTFSDTFVIEIGTGIIITMIHPRRAPLGLFGPTLFFLGLSLLPRAEALTVNRLNGGMNLLYVDFSIPGPVLPVELIRSYNSITATNEFNGWNGAFGWGWTSALETTLTITPERHVLLRDGAAGNTVTFKPEKEDPKAREAFFENIKRSYYERKTGKKYSDAELKMLQLPEKILSRLKTDPNFRVELAMKFNLKGTIPKGELLVSSEYGYQTLQFKNNQWIREKDGLIQNFDSEGRITLQKDKNGFFIEYKYANQKLKEIDAQDRITTLKFTWRNDRISEVTDNRNQRSKYTYDALGNLTHVTDSTQQSFQYKYENRKFPHLLTKIEYLSEGTAKSHPYRELHYDDNGLVVFDRGKDGVESEYTYGKKPNDPENTLWTKTVKREKGVASEEYDEFFIKPRPDGTKYLYKQESRASGSETTTLFTACCGKPQQIIRNGEVTNFKYLENGLLTEKVGPKEDIRLEYDPRWKKVTKVSLNGFVSNYEYDARGNLVKAFNTHNEHVALRYDSFGRITEMTDPEGQQIAFKYGDLGKPTFISEKNIGAIHIDYDRVGRISKTETIMGRENGRKPSEVRSQEVVKHVMKGFQHLLDIIRPAGVNLATGS
jgi:YD repeat-containing protein